MGGLDFKEVLAVFYCMEHKHPKMLSQSKAKEILRHEEVHGEPLSKKQKGLFGLIAGGGKPTRIAQAKALKRS